MGQSAFRRIPNGTFTTTVSYFGVSTQVLGGAPNQGVATIRVPVDSATLGIVFGVFALLLGLVFARARRRRLAH